MLFSNVIGQQSVKERIIQMIKNGRLPHALLITGKSGFGTLPLALAISQYLQCEAPNDNDACGKCTSCIQSVRLEHPDIHYTFPTIAPKPGSKNLSEYFIGEFKEFAKQTPYSDIFSWFQLINVENKQGNISVDECRKVLEKMTLKSYQGKYKVSIFWQPEYLGKEGNVLLKFIEEPAPNTFLIFVAENEEKILGTIRSRLQKILVKPIAFDELEETLMMKHHKSDSDAQKVAFMSEGNYQKALDMMQHWDNEWLDEVIKWLNATYANQGVNIAAWVDTISKMGRESIKNLLAYIQELFSMALRTSLMPDYILHLPDADVAFIRKLSKMGISVEIFEKINEGLARTAYHIERNASPKIQLQHLSIQMQYWIKGGNLQPKF